MWIERDVRGRVARVDGRERPQGRSRGRASSPLVERVGAATGRVSSSRGGFSRAAAHRAQRRAVAISRRAERRGGVVFAAEPSGGVWEGGEFDLEDGLRGGAGRDPPRAERADGGSGRVVAGGVGEGEAGDAELDGVLAAGVCEDEVAALVEAAAGPRRDGERVGERARGWAEGGGVGFGDEAAEHAAGDAHGGLAAEERRARLEGLVVEAVVRTRVVRVRVRVGVRVGLVGVGGGVGGVGDGAAHARPGCRCGRRERAVGDARGERGGELDALGG